MERIKNFRDFVNEAQFSLKSPDGDGDKFANILSINRNVKEEPKGSNRGRMVSAYLASTGLGGGYPWCMAFVYYIFNELSKQLGQTNPLPKTAGCMSHWDKAPADVKITIAQAKQDPNLVRPGQIFIMSRPGKGLGHTGIVLGVDPQKRTFTTMEGNTNDQQSGEGDRVGVNRRKLDKLPLLGFIDYFKGTRTPEFEKDIISAIDKSKIPLSPLDNIPSDAVVSGYEEGPNEIKTKPAGFVANLLAGLSQTVSGKLASADEIEAQLGKLR